MDKSDSGPTVISLDVMEEDNTVPSTKDKNDNEIISEALDTESPNKEADDDDVNSRASSDKPSKSRIRSHNSSKSPKRSRRHKQDKGDILKAVLDELPSSEGSGQSSEHSGPVLHRRHMRKAATGSREQALSEGGVIGEDKLTTKYNELQDLLEDQFAAQQRILHRQQLGMAKRIMRQYKMMSEGIVGHMQSLERPSSAPVSERQRSGHVNLSYGQRSSSAERSRSKTPRGRRRTRKSSPKYEASTQTGANGHEGTSELLLIDATGGHSPQRKVTFRESAWKSDGSGDSVEVISCTRSPPKKHVKKKKARNRSRSDSSEKRSRSSDSMRYRTRSMSSDGGSTRSPSASDSDYSPSRKPKHSDHQLKNTDNPKLLKWLKVKNRELRKQKARERKEERRKRQEKEKEEEEKKERKEKSKEKVKEWMRSKSQERASHRKKKADAKRDSASEASDEEEVEYLDTGGKIYVGKKKKNKEKADGAEDGEKETEQESADHSQEKGEEEANETKATIEIEDKTVQKRGRQHKLKMAQKLISADSLPERPASASSGRMPFSNNTLPNLRAAKARQGRSRSPKKKVELPPATKEAQKANRMSYDDWLKQKRTRDAEKRKAERRQKLADEAAMDPDMVDLISDVARKRVNNIMNQRKKIDTGLPDIDQAANRPLPATLPKVTGTVSHVENGETDSGKTSLYKLPDELNGHNEQRAQVGLKGGKVRPTSAKGHYRSAPAPKASQSGPHQAKGRSQAKGKTSQHVPSPPTSTKSLPTRPRVSSAAYRKVKREQKSWDEFADHIWEKLNTEEEEAETQRVEPQGSDQPPETFTSETVAVLERPPSEEPPSLKQEIIQAVQSVRVEATQQTPSEPPEDTSSTQQEVEDRQSSDQGHHEELDHETEVEAKGSGDNESEHDTTEEQTVEAQIVETVNSQPSVQEDNTETPTEPQESAVEQNEESPAESTEEPEKDSVALEAEEVIEPEVSTTQQQAVFLTDGLDGQEKKDSVSSDGTYTVEAAEDENVEDGSNEPAIEADAGRSESEAAKSASLDWTDTTTTEARPATPDSAAAIEEEISPQTAGVTEASQQADSPNDLDAAKKRENEEATKSVTFAEADQEIPAESPAPQNDVADSESIHSNPDDEAFEDEDATDRDAASITDTMATDTNKENID